MKKDIFKTGDRVIVSDEFHDYSGIEWNVVGIDGDEIEVISDLGWTGKIYSESLSLVSDKNIGVRSE